LTFDPPPCPRSTRKPSAAGRALPEPLAAVDPDADVTFMASINLLDDLNLPDIG
jgi:hypothetical protein